jgi:phospho-N-acetylmuramoyl-pentapeptide-transferase
VDAKVIAPGLKKPSGTILFVVLTIFLLLAAIAFDRTLGQNLPEQHSSIIPLAISAGISGVLGYAVIPILQKLKAGQVIREDGPEAHLKKAGTPTMGGIFFVPVGLFVAFMWSGFSLDVLAAIFVTLAYGFIGWIDDWQILVMQSNKGISPKIKLLLQLTVAVIFCAWIALTKSDEITNVSLPGIILPLGILFWPLAGFVLAAETNATNLTDGVDGLAAGTGAIALLGMGAIVAGDSPDLMVFCACLSGACLGFLLHNRNPAKVFMGDTGSLALGGALAAVGLVSNHLWDLFIISGIFFVESVSVIAQVSYYKATKDPDGKGKRLLKMAPLHHHLELTGWSETQIVGAFYAINALLCVLAFFLV